MDIPFLDLKASYTELKDEIDLSIQRVMDSGYYILGPEVEAFETQFSKYCEAKYAVGVANGLDALIMALKALGIKQGDDVIVPTNTYIATWLAISLIGARPVPVEPNPKTHNLDHEKLEDVKTQNTRAIIAVHLYGQPADLDEINKFAKSNNLAVIEDAAQAHGAKYKDKRIGAISDIVCWSFYPGKNLGAFGDGGAVTTNNIDIYNKLKMLRNYGSNVRYNHEIIGYNSRLDPVQAAILNIKLKHLDEWNNRRKQIANHYRKNLDNELISIPFVPDWCDPAWHLFVIKCKNRNALQNYLTNKGITTIIHYPTPPYLQKAYEGAHYNSLDYPIATALADEVLSLPIGPHQTQKQTDYIIEIINSAKL